MRDAPTTVHLPVATLVLIALCFVGYGWQATLDAETLAGALQARGVVPAEVTGLAWTTDPAAVLGLVASFFLSPFLHHGLVPLFFNTVLLWICADNVEDHMGKLGFVVFFFTAHVVASLAAIALAPASTVPIVGASGATAVVMGVYLALYPRADLIALRYTQFRREQPFLRSPAWVALPVAFLIKEVGTSVSTPLSEGYAVAHPVLAQLAALVILSFGYRWFIDRARDDEIDDQRRWGAE